MFKYLRWPIILLLSFVLMELCSFAGIYLLFKIGKREYLKTEVSKFHPLFRKRSDNVGNPIPLSQRRDKRNPFAFSPHTGYTNKPGSFYENSIKIGDDGFICNAECNELSVAKPKNQLRIFIFGGSTVAGSGVENGAQTISGQLETFINKKNLFPKREVRIINAGVGGFFSFQEVARFIDTVLKYQPDMVIFFNGHNDYRYWQRDIGPPNFHSYDNQLINGFNNIQDFRGAISHAMNIFDQYLPIFHYTLIFKDEAKNLLHSFKKKPNKKIYANSVRSNAEVHATDTNISKIEQKLYAKNINSIANYMDNLYAAAGICKLKKIRGIFCLQPTLGFNSKKIFDGHEKTIFSTLYKVSPYIDIYFKHAQKEFKRAGQLNDSYIRFVDMTGIFQGVQKQVYVDNCHYNETGNRIIAKSLSEEIIKMLGVQSRAIQSR